MARRYISGSPRGNLLRHSVGVDTYRHLSKKWHPSPPIFQLGESSRIALQRGIGNATFTRTSSATVIDHEGLVRTVPANCALRTGARFVQNYAASGSSNDFTHAAWTKIRNANAVSANVLNFTAATSDVWPQYDTVYQSLAGDIPLQNHVVASIELSGIEGETLRLYMIGSSGGAVSVTVTLTATPVRYSLGRISPGEDSAWGPSFYIERLLAHTATVVYASEVLLEDVTGQSNQNPGEYVSVGVESAPYHGLGADGIKAFDYANGNTVDGSGVVTEAAGAVISPAPMWEHQPASENLCTYSYDLTQWDTPRSSLLDETGIDGHPAKASTSTTTSGSFDPVFHAITCEIADYTVVFAIKKTTGATTFPGMRFYLITANTWYGLTLNTNTGAYTVRNLSQPISPVVKSIGNWWYVAIEGASAAVDTLQMEIFPAANTDMGATWSSTPAGSVVTGYVGLYKNTSPQAAINLSPIPTSGAAASRTTPVWKYPRAGNVDETSGTLVVKGLIPGAAYADVPDGTVLSYVSLKDITYNLLYANRTSNPYGVFPRSYDGSWLWGIETYEWLAGNEYNLAVRWNATTLKRQVGYQDVTGAGSWQWGTEVAFDGAFAIGDFIQLFYNNAYPQKFRDIRIWDDDKGTYFIEARY